MKLFYTLTTTLLLVQGFCSAQDLAANAPSASSNTVSKNADHIVSPVWNKERDQVTGHIDRTKLTSMKSITDTVMIFLKQNCISEGSYTPVWHAEYFSEKVTANKQMKSIIKCDFADQKAQLTIETNDMSRLLQPFVVNNQPFYSLQSAKSLKNGAICFEGEADDVMARSWLVINGDQQPYLIVSRKEYLENAQGELNAAKKTLYAQLQTRMPVRPTAAQEAEKKAIIDDMNTRYSGSELQFRMRQFTSSYKSDEDYLKEAFDKESAPIDSTLKMVDNMAHNLTKEDGERPAVVSVPAMEFTGFEDGKNNFILVKMNPGYFSLTVGQEKPQFFLVSWTYNKTAPQAAELDKQLEEKLDCNKLKTLLGK